MLNQAKMNSKWNVTVAETSNTLESLKLEGDEWPSLGKNKEDKSSCNISSHSSPSESEPQSQPSLSTDATKQNAQQQHAQSVQSSSRRSDQLSSSGPKQDDQPSSQNDGSKKNKKKWKPLVFQPIPPTTSTGGNKATIDRDRDRRGVDRDSGRDGRDGSGAVRGNRGRAPHESNYHNGYTSPNPRHTNYSRTKSDQQYVGQNGAIDSTGAFVSNHGSVENSKHAASGTNNNTKQVNDFDPSRRKNFSGPRNNSGGKQGANGNSRGYGRHNISNGHGGLQGYESPVLTNGTDGIVAITNGTLSAPTTVPATVALLSDGSITQIPSTAATVVPYTSTTNGYIVFSPVITTQISSVTVSPSTQQTAPTMAAQFMPIPAQQLAAYAVSSSISPTIGLVNGDFSAQTNVNIDASIPSTPTMVALVLQGQPTPVALQGPAQPPPPPQLTLTKENLSKQIEYYFSEENLSRDIFMRRNMDKNGFLPVGMIASFNRIRSIGASAADVVDAVRDSTTVQLSEDETKIRPIHEPLRWPIAETPVSGPVSPFQLPPGAVLVPVAVGNGSVTGPVVLPVNTTGSSSSVQEDEGDQSSSSC